jgi:hypothetical protein
MSYKKLGIVTFHNAHNYGAVLQAYALHRKLELMGYESEFIQDADNVIGATYDLYPKWSKGSFTQYARDWIRLILDFKRKKERFNAFQSFISDKLPTYNLANGKKNYHSVILGSDQIWNFNITNGLDILYFGQDKNISTNNVFSYAASMGKAMLETNFTQAYKENLQKLSCIGVREESLGLEIKDKFGLDYHINVDPTLLLAKSEWDALVTKKSDCEEYILVYEVEKHQYTQDVVDAIKNQLGLSVKVISSITHRAVDKSTIATASPVEFLTMFKNAKFVVTSSFHGTVFSIINEVPFYTLKFNNGVDLRSAGLLNSLGLIERHINGPSDLKVGDFNVDFSNAKLLLKDLRSDSESYLKSNILN